MNEGDARQWLVDQFDVPRETMLALERLCTAVDRGSMTQNLVSSSTLEALWGRHIVDSAQLVPLLGDGPILDVGSGAGFPGLVIAILTRRPLILVEPRRKRADFLASTASDLRLTVEVRRCRVEMLVAPPFGTIVARAVASLGDLLAAAHHLAGPGTRWVLPKGRSVESELAAAQETWQGAFRTVPSVTDPQAAIVVAEHVRRKARR